LDCYLYHVTLGVRVWSSYHVRNASYAISLVISKIQERVMTFIDLNGCHRMFIYTQHLSNPCYKVELYALTTGVVF